MIFIVEQKTSKGWEIAHEEQTLEQAVERVEDFIKENVRSRLTVEPTITPR